MRAFLVAAPMVFALTACLGELPPTERLGLVNVRTYSNGGTPVVRGSAVFYRARGLQLLPSEPQACALFGYTPPTSSDNAGQTLNAGLTLNFTVGAVSQVATHALNAVHPVYDFPGGAYLDFTTGDSVLVSIPGATGGFEATAVKARLAEAFVGDTLPTYVENMPMDVTWEPATTPGSIMVVSLRFNTVLAATVPNVEVACAFEDDGTGQIPVTFVNGYFTSGPASRSYAYVRVRDRIVEFDSRTRTRVRSVFEYPLVDLVDAP